VRTPGAAIRLPVARRGVGVFPCYAPSARASSHCAVRWPSLLSQAEAGAACVARSPFRYVGNSTHSSEVGTRRAGAIPRVRRRGPQFHLGVGAKSAQPRASRRQRSRARIPRSGRKSAGMARHVPTRGRIILSPCAGPRITPRRSSPHQPRRALGRPFVRARTPSCSTAKAPCAYPIPR